jgi:hypothetical protein
VLLINNTEIYGDMIIELQNIWLAKDSIDSKIIHTQAKINAVNKEIEALVAEVDEIGDTTFNVAILDLLTGALIIFVAIIVGVMYKTNRISFFTEEDFGTPEDEFEEAIQRIKGEYKEPKQPKPERKSLKRVKRVSTPKGVKVYHETGKDFIRRRRRQYGTPTSRSR